MGLLTGFSILSAVEIMYFAAKACIGLGKKMTKKLKIEKNNKVTLVRENGGIVIGEQKY